MIYKIIFLGLFFGLLDTIPMIINKIEKHAILSAFVYHLIMPFILFHFSPYSYLIINGAFLYLICSIPIVILVFKDDKKSVPIILCTSIVVGILSGFLLQHI